MFFRPVGLYCNACYGILFVSILCTYCSHFSWYCFISFTIFCASISFLLLTLKQVLFVKTLTIFRTKNINFSHDIEKCHYATVVNREKQEIYFLILINFDTNNIKAFFCLFGVMFIFSACCLLLSRAVS